uniref:Pollen Ole e 1 allergen and extensin family protein n=1 Tax=Manihot esculenta TaxID=3983 RepID=A0A2C9VYE5_MANES
MVVRLVTVLFFALALSGVQLSTCHVLKGNLTCLDCSSHYDFSGIKVVVKCANVKKLATSTATSEGSFEVELPIESSSSTPLNCVAKIEEDGVKDCEKPRRFTPLAFSTTSPPLGKLKGIDSSKTVDLPLPREWGLAPSSYYVPFFPIIGIP